MMHKYIARYQNEAKAQLPGIGVVVHGPVKAGEGISIFAPNIGWKNVPIKFIVEDKFHIPTFVENDVRAMTLGEFYYGAARDVNNMVFLKVGYGIGSGIIMDGRLYQGVGDSAGEIGHTTIDVGGPQCGCGNYGCLEAMASENALVKTMVKSIKEGRDSMVFDLVSGNLEDVTPEIVYEAAANGDILASRILRQIARYLGIAVGGIRPRTCHFKHDRSHKTGGKGCGHGKCSGYRAGDSRTCGYRKGLVNLCRKIGLGKHSGHGKIQKGFCENTHFYGQ
jgi:predicted NBD/HSP70 family sugar kinase